MPAMRAIERTQRVALAVLAKGGVKVQTLLKARKGALADPLRVFVFAGDLAP